MALLRNRPVIVIGPNGAEVSPIYTVQYPDGTSRRCSSQIHSYD